MNCPLCERKKLSHWYYEDDLIWVANCTFHKVPMIILKRHSLEPNEEEWARILEVKNRLFPTLRFRSYMGRIRDHWHDHLIL